MSYDESERWRLAMIAKGHLPKMDPHDPKLIDRFALDSTPHNGPGCELCHWSVCEHCADVDSIPQCDAPLLELTAQETKLIESKRT